jgi:hypothetical protein
MRKKLKDCYQIAKVTIIPKEGFRTPPVIALELFKKF